MKPASERDIQSAILVFLALHPRVVRAWRTNAGMMPMFAKGKRYVVRFAPKGTADIIGLLAGGVFLAIEVKRPGKEPTAEQLAWGRMVTDMGGIYFVARSVDDVQRGIAPWLHPHPAARMRIYDHGQGARSVRARKAE